MKTLTLFCLIFFCFNCIAQKKIIGEIFDTQGKRVFYVEDTGEMHKKGSANGEVVQNVLKFHCEDGQVYDFDYTWDQIIKDGSVFINFNFNKDEWELVDKAKLAPSKSPKREQIQRIYSVLFENYRTAPGRPINSGSIVTVSEQGKVPIFVYKKGLGFMNEFGETIYVLNDTLKAYPNQLGSHIPAWCTIILLHHYYEESYINSDHYEKIKEIRKIQADSLENTNSIMLDMLALGKRYETEAINLAGQHFKMLYFTTVDGKLVILTSEQVSSLKNKWILINKDTGQTFNMNLGVPAGGFPVSRKNAKKMGIEEVDGRTRVIEIKCKPEFQSEFNLVVLK